MKSFLMGCGVAAILLIALVVGGGILAVKTGKRMGASINTAQEELRATDREFPFRANEATTLTETRLMTWIKVREANAASEKSLVSEGSKRGPLAALRIMRAMPDTLRTCAANLRQEKMSAEEYAWITQQVMGALRSRAAEKDPALAELERLSEELAPEMRQRGIRQQGRMNYAPLAPEEAQPILELVKKHADAFRKAAYANMGDGFILSSIRGGRQGLRVEQVTSGTATTVTVNADAATTR